VRGETVWKIAGGVSARLSGAKKRPNWYSLDPSWPLSDTRFGTYPEFPNSFGIGILGSSLAGSWIKPRDTPPRWPWEGPIRSRGVAQDPGRCDHDYPQWVGHKTSDSNPETHSLVLDPPASIRGRSPLGQELRPFALPFAQWGSAKPTLPLPPPCWHQSTPPP
jgi:hypothetical protein